MNWVNFKETCPNRISNAKYGHLCNEAGRLIDPVGLNRCMERYCPFCIIPSEDVKFSLESLGLEIKMANNKFNKIFNAKSARCKHRKTDDTSVSPDECLCLKDKSIGETFCSIYSCPYINNAEYDEEYGDYEEDDNVE